MRPDGVAYPIQALEYFSHQPKLCDLVGGVNICSLKRLANALVANWKSQTRRSVDARMTDHTTDQEKKTDEKSCRHYLDSETRK
jgi:hypothetical protein